MAFSVKTMAFVDALQLECDGLTRVLSTLMQRDGIDHRVLVGELEVIGIGTIPYHWWIELPDGTLCDFRARMWLGDHEDVPHGVFLPSPSLKYRASKEREPCSIGLIPTFFHALTGAPLAGCPPLQVAAQN